MQAAPRIISADTHVFEPRDLWTNRVKASRFADRVPRVLREANGGDYWWSEGKWVSWLAAGVQPGVRFEDRSRLSRISTWEQVCRGGYVPDECIKAMDADGVAVSILYPTIGVTLYYTTRDSELLSVLFAAFNDWLAEFCKACPSRLKGIAALNVDDVAEGVKELERCARLGLAGALIPAYYGAETTRYSHPSYEPLWTAAEALRMPLSLHFGTNRLGAGLDGMGSGTRSPSGLANADHWVRMSLGDMIFSGVFERHPKLHVGSVEHEIAWLPHFLERMDYTARERFLKDDGAALRMLPSECFHRNIFASFTEDRIGIGTRHLIGVENLLWGSDYPHIESTWPKSREFLDTAMRDCSENERHQMTCGNAARIYNLAPAS